MSRTGRNVSLGSIIALAVVPMALLAQAPPLNLPQASPHASVSQTVGLTEVTIDYHRPATNKRTVWGSLVPWDQVWRAGANENTTITFSTPVKVESRQIPAGTYGLHLIPRENADWTLILSNDSKAWGSFAYDEARDALRVPVHPEPAPQRERLLYIFEEPAGNSVTASLNWETLRIPFRIEVDLPALVTADLNEQLTGLAQFFWQPWNQAAAWATQNGGDVDQAMTWAERSITINENFQNLRTKAAILEKKGHTSEADALRARAMTIATEADINAYGYQLLGQNKMDEAIAIFQKNIKDHPDSWNARDSLAEAYARKGDKKSARENYERAKKMTKDPRQVTRIDGELAKLR